MQVKDLKKLLATLENSMDECDVTIYDIATGNRIILNVGDIDLDCRDLFEINVDSTELRNDYE